jgi:hypothetical protein
MYYRPALNRPGLLALNETVGERGNFLISFSISNTLLDSGCVNAVRI